VPIVFAAIAPHGTMVLEDDAGAAARTRSALEELGRRFDEARPEVTVVLTPHGVHVDGSFAVVVAGALSGTLDDPPAELSCPVASEPAAALLEALRADGIPAVGVSFGGNDPDEAVMPMDWGTMVPLWFMGGRSEPQVPAVVVSPARSRPLEEHTRAGAAIARAARSRVAVVASADHGHAHDAEGPYGFDPAAAQYDRRLQALLDANRLDRIGELAELAGPAKADSLWQLVMLHGALDDGFSCSVLSYEAPTYFGMLCAAYEPRASPS
jgi:aromatic ring-opening dioxygenase LigB subunit